MSGRRSHVRYTVLQSPEGFLRVMRDVIVERAVNREVVVISRDAGVLGEVVIVQTGLEDGAVGLEACVVDSQPVVVDGVLRHRVRLQEASAAIQAFGGAGDAAVAQ